MKKIAAVLFFLSAYAFSLTANEALDKSKSWFKSSSGWSFDFKVSTYLSDSPAEARQKGNMIVKEGNKFKLTIPGFTFISDGESFWQWNVEQKQVLIKAVEDLESTMQPSEMLFKYLNCKALSIKDSSWQGVHVYVLSLSPSAYKDQFTEMEVWLLAKDFSPVRLFTLDNVGNTSWYDISNLKIRRDLKDDDFKYKSVKNIDEIDMR